MVMSGVMATIATNPNASVKMAVTELPFNTKHTPMINGRMKVEELLGQTRRGRLAAQVFRYGG